MYQLKVKHPACAMISADYSQQEPRLTSFVSNDPTLIKAFQEGKDVYATLSSISFKRPYEECLEFNPKTHEYQPEGKALRNKGKVLNLGRPRGCTPCRKCYAPLVEALVYRLLSVNFVNCITHRCANNV